MENKDPNEQMSSVVNAWAESQKRMWGDWSALLQNLPGGNEGPVEAVKKGVETANKSTNEAARLLMDRISSSQGAMNRVMDFFFKSMKVVAPNLEANKDWRPDLKGFAEQWAKESTAMLERSFGMGSHLGSLSGTLSKDLPEAMGPWLSFPSASVAAVRHQFDDARAWIEQVLLVDPVDLGVNMNRGDHMLLQRRYADAVRALQRTLELKASHRPSQLRLAWALALDGRTQAAREQLAACGATQDAAWLETAALVEAACGDCAAAARHADALDQLARSHPVTPWMRARAAAVAGRPQRALDALAEAANDRTSS